MKDKSDKHKDRVKELKAMSKFLQKKVTKKEFNISQEIKLNGNVHQVIRQELIIIKMLESKLNYDYNFYIESITETINNFLEYNRKNFLANNKEKIMKYFIALLEEKLAVYNLLGKKFRKYIYYMALSGSLFHKFEMHN